MPDSIMNVGITRHIFILNLYFLRGPRKWRYFNGFSACLATVLRPRAERTALAYDQRLILPGAYNSSYLCPAYIQEQHQGGVKILLQQDNAMPHKAQSTQRRLREEEIIVLDWPYRSPDFSPIETVWCWMKVYIQRVYGSIDFSAPSARLRRIVQEAWDSNPNEQIERLIMEMPHRIQAVIQA